MDYRPLNEQDRAQLLALESYAFQVNPELMHLDQARIGQFRGMFEGSTLRAQLELIPLRMRAGLGDLVAAGLGSVASAPATRRRGDVAALLRHTAAELRATGVPLAVLYPFKRSFYNRYGWATFYERRCYSGSPSLFAHFRRAPGRFTPAGEEEIAELDRIYSGALRGRFGPLVRDEHWWQQRLLHDGQGRPRHAYIWRDEQGRGRSYLIYRIADEATGRCFESREMVALDPLARGQLFVFVAGHQDQVANVRFRAPADAPVNLLFPDPLECLIEPQFMLRLLDVPAALAAYSFPPSLGGQLSLAVEDAWLEENRGVFELEWHEGRCQVRRLPAGTPANLHCDVRVLTQIYSRYLRPRTAAAFGLLEAPGREALARFEAAFAGLAPFGSEFF